MINIFQKKKKLISTIGIFIIMTIFFLTYTYKLSSKFALSEMQVANTIKIGHVGKSANLLYYLADDLGYFHEEDIRAELSLYESDKEGISALLAGDIDTGSFKTMASLLAIEAGGDLKIHGGGLQHGYALFTLKDKESSYDILENYRGKTIGVIRDSMEEVLMKVSIGRLDLEVGSQIDILQYDSLDYLLEAIKNKEVDSGAFSLPDLDKIHRENLRIAIDSINLIKKYPSYSQVIKASILEEKKNEELLIRYHRALIKAYKYYLENPDATIDILSNYIETDRELLIRDIYDEEKNINSQRFWPNPNPNKEYYDVFLQSLDKLNYLTSDDNKKRRYVFDAIYFKAMNELAKETNDPVYRKLQRQFLC